MSNKIIIELELLTPLRYEKMFLRDRASQPVIRNITKLHLHNNELTNIDLSSINPKRIENREHYEGFERIYYMKGYEWKRVEKIYEFKGLHPEEFKQECNLYYKILNFPDKGLNLVRRINDTYHCFVKPTDLDKDTIETFKDMFDEL